MKDGLIEKSEQEIAGLPVPLRALWYAAHGNWVQAHCLVQDDPSQDSAWVHAYLHRVEGDIGNARYWYHQAGRTPALNIPVEQELEALIGALSH